MNKDINPYNDKGESHGYCEVYWSKDELWYKRIYNNGKIIGYCENYHYFRDYRIIKVYYL